MCSHQPLWWFAENGVATAKENRVLVERAALVTCGQATR